MSDLPSNRHLTGKKRKPNNKNNKNNKNNESNYENYNNAIYNNNEWVNEWNSNTTNSNTTPALSVEAIHVSPPEDMHRRQPSSPLNNDSNPPRHPEQNARNPHNLEQRLHDVEPRGLAIGNYIFNRISGPMSMYVMVPTPDTKVQDIHRPPILLFGDHHGYNERMCRKCSVKNECGYIGDPEFYKALDRIATPTAPVDVFTEFYMDQPVIAHTFKQHAEEYDQTPFDDVNRIMDRCSAWDSLLRRRFRLLCPTQHVRYHYGDPRDSLTKQKSLSFETTMYTLQQYPTETRSFPSSYHSMYASLHHRRTHAAAYAEQAFHLIQSAGTTRSIIAKELSRMPASFDPAWIKQMIIHSVMVDDEPDTIELPWITDVYTLLRMFKKPSLIQGIRPVYPALSILYFGDYHILSIKKSLEVIFGYRCMYSNTELLSGNSKSNDRTIRCIVVDQPINVNLLIANARPFSQTAMAAADAAQSVVAAAAARGGTYQRRSRIRLRKTRRKRRS